MEWWRSNLNLKPQATVMIRLTLTDKTGASETHFYEGNSLTVGRLRHNDLVLPKTNVSKRHIKIVWKNQQFTVIDLGSTNGSFVNGDRLSEPRTLTSEDVVSVGDYTISVDREPTPDSFNEPAPPSAPSDGNTPPVLDALSVEEDGELPNSLEGLDPFAEFIPATTSIPADQLPKPGLKKSGKGKGVGSTMALGSLSEEERDAVSAALGISEGAPQSVPPLPLPPEPVEEEPEEEIESASAPEPEPEPKPAPKSNYKETRGLEGIAIGPDPELKTSREIDPEEIASDVDNSDDFRSRLFAECKAATAQGRQQLLDARFDNEAADLEDYKVRISQRVATVIHAFEQAEIIPEDEDRDSLLEHYHKAMLGLGPLDEILADEKIREIRIFGPDQILVMKDGKARPADLHFMDQKSFELTLESLYLLSDSDPNDPDVILKGSLGKGIQYSLVADPLATSTPAIRITRYGYPERGAEEHLADLVKKGLLSPEYATAIDNAVQNQSGILIVGPSLEARTRILSAVVSELPENASACMFSLPSLAPRVACPTMHMDRRLLTSGHGFLSDLISSFAPDHVIAVELQNQEISSHEGLLTAMVEGSALIATLGSANAADFVENLETSMSFASPGTSAQDRNKLIAKTISLVIESPSASDSESAEGFTASSIVYKDGTLQLNPVSS